MELLISGRPPPRETRPLFAKRSILRSPRPPRHLGLSLAAASPPPPSGLSTVTPGLMDQFVPSSSSFAAVYIPLRLLACLKGG